MEIFITLLCVISGLYIILKFLRANNAKSPPPGPKGYPLVGAAFQLDPEKIHESFSVLADTHGDIFQVQIFDSISIVLNSTDLINKAFVSEAFKDVFNNRPHIYFADKYYFNSQSLTYMNLNKDHGNIKKLFVKGLHVYGDGIPKFEEIVKNELKRVMSEIESSSEEGFEVVGTIRRSMCNIISMLLIGKEASEQDVQNFMEFVYEEDYFLNPLTNTLMCNFPFLRHLPTYKTELKKAEQAKKAILDKYFVSMKETYEEGTVRGLVDYFIGDQLKDQANDIEPLMTDDKIQANIIDLVAAGVLTTTAALQSIILCLITHPEYHTKLQQELDRLVGTERRIVHNFLGYCVLTTSAVLPSTILCLITYPEYQTKMQREIDRVIGKDRDPCVTDKGHCDFLEAVVMETLRYLPPLPVLLPHVCTKDTELEGYLIKAKSVIFANVWHIHHDQKIWSDPWIFRPERFLDENGKLIPSSNISMKSLIPFGTGRRRCPGDTLAKTRIFLYLATFFKKWTFSPVPGKVGSSDPRDGDFHIDIIYKPKPFYCIVKDRL